jgi:hypothetical protein
MSAPTSIAKAVVRGGVLRRSRTVETRKNSRTTQPMEITAVDG